MKKNKISDPYQERESEKYENPIPSRECILSIFNKESKILSSQMLTLILELSKINEQEALKKRLKAMRRDGQLLWIRGKGYALPKTSIFIKGKVVGSREDFGFVQPEDNSADLFLNGHQMRQVFPGDRVLIKVVGVSRRGRREATIVEILDRSTEYLTGIYLEKNNLIQVKPTHPKIHHVITIPAGFQSTAKNEEIVLVEIIRQPDSHHFPTGRVVKIFGSYSTPGIENILAVHQYHLPHEWSSAVQKETHGLEKLKNSLHVDTSRKDLRSLAFVTIDGEDSKDFDDAVYCTHQGKDWKLQVAISDVTHYVAWDTAIDQEARLRGNSVYFPTQVIPMLPEILSNDLCSLKPNVDRYCLVCEMIVSSQGKIKEYTFYFAVIHSKARLTYNKVTDFFKNNFEIDKDSDVVENLKNLEKVYEGLSKARQKRGAIDFDFAEVQLVFDTKHNIQNIIPKERTIAHRIIEECMLAANVSAANFLLKNKLNAIFRVHEPPNPDKIEDLKDFLKQLGISTEIEFNSKPIEYKKTLQKIITHPHQRLLQTLFLRSMNQAIYAIKNQGHFGLSYSEYTHFTSPIRRYSDLIVHRLIREILLGSKRKSFLISKSNLDTIAEHCSKTERKADEASRMVVSAIKCRFIQKHLGEFFEGVISHVTAFGFFVELRENLVEGLVRIDCLSDDHYVFDVKRMLLQGKVKKKNYRLGDHVRIQVAKVSLSSNSIDFILA